MHFLDDHHRLRVVPKSRIRESHACGAFALPKDEQKDPLIVDGRPANELEETLRSWCATLGSVQALCQLEMLPSHRLVFSGTDLRDYYYCFKVSPERSYRNVLRFPLTPKQAQKFQSFDHKLLTMGHTVFLPLFVYSCYG